MALGGKSENARRVRAAAVAGSFYPGERERLARSVRELLSAAPAPRDPRPAKALIVPHAGYMYSGAVAACAYAAAPRDARLAIVLGPSHFVPLEGLATSAAEAFETPLGRVAIDAEARGRALSLAAVSVSEAAHSREHSIETQLPFLQSVLGSFSFLPFAVGHASDQEVAAVLEKLWGGPETLIVISSDLSHYHDYETAAEMDAATARAIESFRLEEVGADSACGRVGVRGLLLAAHRAGLEVERLALASSGDTAGPRDEVVGYGAWALRPTG